MILVTGPTGYVGGRLVPKLLAAGRRVRVLARDPSRLAGRPWLPRVEVAAGDVLAPETLVPALGGVSVAYYLVHGMAGGGHFGERDLAAAEGFGRAARQAGVERIVYLGGLGDPATGLSAHLCSRQESGERLRAAGVPVTELRAAVIVGSGSLRTSGRRARAAGPPPGRRVRATSSPATGLCIGALSCAALQAISS